MRQMISLAAILVLIGLYFLFTRPETSPSAPTGFNGTGVAAPDFTLKDLQGNEVTLSKHKGKVILLNFWATWCPACREEMPSMDRLYSEFTGRNFIVLTVSLDQNVDLVRDFLKQNSYDFPVLLDPYDRVRNLYGVFRLPETFLIDSQGTIVGHYIGARDWSSDDFLAKTRSLLRE